MQQVAKIFTNGRSQAVRLPLEFRFDVSEVYIHRDAATGSVVLTPKPDNWKGLLDAVAANRNEEALPERRQRRTRRDPFESPAGAA